MLDNDDFEPCSDTDGNVDEIYSIQEQINCQLIAVVNAMWIYSPARTWQGYDWEEIHTHIYIQYDRS